MRISITLEDIKMGRRCDPHCCPVGRALVRAGVQHLGVVGAGVLIMDERHYTELVPLPELVSEWILAFDGDRPVEPISFELTLPWEGKAKTHAARTERHKRTQASAQMALARS